MFCRNCGKEVKDGASFCPGCGKPLRAEAPQKPNPPEKKKTGGIIAKLILWLLAVVILATVILGALVSFRIVDIPVISGILESIGLMEDDSDEQEEEAEEPADEEESDDEEEPVEEEEPEEEETAAPTESPRDAAYRETEEHCETLAAENGALEAVAYLLALNDINDPRYQDLLEQYQQQAEDEVLADAAAFAEDGEYRQAAEIVLTALAIHDCDVFRDQLLEYRPYLSIPLGSCALVEDSNSGGKTNDVCMGAWEDVHGFAHYDAVRYWVINKSGYNNTEYAVYALNGEFHHLSGQIVSEADSDRGSDAVIRIYLDGELAYTSPVVSAESEAVSFELDVSGIQQLRVECSTDSPYFNYCILDASISEV